MSCGGTSFPRRNVGVGGLWVRWAQSRGEWPGSRITFLDERDDGARVEVVGARDAVVGARERDGEPRRVDAAEGSGRRGVDGFGGDLNIGTLGVGFERGSIGAVGSFSYFCFGYEAGGGGMETVSELSAVCDRGAGFDPDLAAESMALDVTCSLLST